MINIVTGDGETGEAFGRPSRRRQDRVHRLDRGRDASSAGRRPGTGKKLSLELGGKSPFIVFDDADLDSVVEGVVDAIWFNQGQVCCAGSRLLVQESIAERLIEKLRARMEKLRIGDPLDKAVDIGAIVAPVQLERIQRLVAAGRGGGRDDVAAVLGLSDGGLLLPAHAVHRRRARRRRSRRSRSSARCWSR